MREHPLEGWSKCRTRLICNNTKARLNNNIRKEVSTELTMSSHVRWIHFPLHGFKLSFQLFFPNHKLLLPNRSHIVVNNRTSQSERNVDLDGFNQAGVNLQGREGSWCRFQTIFKPYTMVHLSSSSSRFTSRPRGPKN